MNQHFVEMELLKFDFHLLGFIVIIYNITLSKNDECKTLAYDRIILWAFTAK